jgi:hypothetical protein
MTITEQIIEKVQALSPDDQKKILDIIAALPSVQDKKPTREENNGSPTRSRKTLLGRFAHRGIHITAEEINEARREMWSNFPRVPPASKPDAS